MSLSLAMLFKSLRLRRCRGGALVSLLSDPRFVLAVNKGPWHMKESE